MNLICATQAVGRVSQKAGRIARPQGRMIVKYADWPGWVQTLVLLPHAILLSVSAWLWWPKSGREWRKFGFVAGYLVIFYLIMHFVFAF
jgi:hypothetical protein